MRLKFIPPLMPTLVEKPPKGDGWLHEVKFDGYRLLTRIDSIEFPYRDMARVDLTVGSLGREATEDSSFDLAADVEQLSIELQLDDGEWKVTRAQRNRAQ